MGDLWEAGVKSFKTSFYKSTATKKYTFEELSTLLAKIEACLKSRPLSPMSEDQTDLLALTPGWFLVGGPLLPSQAGVMWGSPFVRDGRSHSSQYAEADLKIP